MSRRQLVTLCRQEDRPRSPFISGMPKCVQFHSWFQLRSMKKKSELNPKTHRLAKNHHKSLETESLDSAVLLFSFKYISIQWESDKIIVNITSGICQARDSLTASDNTPPRGDEICGEGNKTQILLKNKFL